jgi:hypothetical protein
VIAATHGKAVLGAKLSDFVGKYGQPSEEAYTFNGEQGALVRVDVGKQDEAKMIVVTWPLSWPIEQATDYCDAFLPDNAKTRQLQLYVDLPPASNVHLYDAKVGKFALVFVGQSCRLAAER